MKHMVWLVALWLTCTSSPVWAWQTKPEVLVYKVSWGGVGLGKAVLAFTPGHMETYALEARVWDETPLIHINNLWRTEGVWLGGRWQPKKQRMLQEENDYRADKTLTFKGNKVVYQNHRGGEPDLTIDLPAGARDALSTLYDLRAQGAGVLTDARTLTVMGVKKPFPLEIKPAVRDKTNLWRVDMFAHNPEKGRMDRWRVWLRDDAALTPVRIEARLKLGTMVAVLDERK